MPLYAWQAVTIQGTLVTGSSWALDEMHLAQELLRSNVGYVASKPWRLPWHKTIGRQAAVIEALRIVQLLVADGVPLLQALATVQSKDPIVALFITTMMQGIAEGYSMQECCLPFTALLGETSSAVLRAGLVSGKLAEALHSIIAYKQQQQQQWATLGQIIMGPAITVVSLFLAIVAIIVFVIPQLQCLLANDSASIMLMQLPCCCYWLSIGFVSMLVAIIGAAVARYYLPSVQWYVDLLIIKTPIIGRLVSALQLHLVWQQVAMMTAVGLPLTDSLQIAATGITNAVLAWHLQQLIDAIYKGVPVASAVEQALGFAMPSSAIVLLRVGIVTGNFTQQSSHVALLLHHETTIIVMRFASLLGPIVLLIAGIAVAVVAAMVMEPILVLPDILARL